MEKLYHENNKHEKAGGAVLMSDKIDLDTKAPLIRKTESP